MKKINKYIMMLPILGSVIVGNILFATSCGAPATPVLLEDLIVNRELGYLGSQNPDLVLQTIVSVNRDSKLKIKEMQVISTNPGNVYGDEQEMYAFINCKAGSKVYKDQAVSVSYSIPYHIPTPLNITNTDLGLLKTDYSDESILEAAASVNPSTDFSELIVNEKDISDPAHATAVIKPNSYTLMYTGLANITFSFCVELSSYLSVTNIGPIPSDYTTYDIQQRINSVNGTEVE
jgi:hypothetical protein